VKITVKGIDAVIRRVTELADLDSKMMEIAYRLCKVGKPIIEATHQHHASVFEPEKTENGYRLSAEGKDLLFVEFGTGNQAGLLRNQYEDVPIVVRPGSWSEAHEGMYAKTGGYPVGFWVFNDTVYRYTEPHPAFYEAYQAMVEALPQIAQEVFAH